MTRAESAFLPDVGETRELIVCEEVTRTQITQYAGASGDFSPLHTDEVAAKRAGHPSIMGHGMMTMAVTARVVTDWFGTESLLTFDARFTAAVWPGDRLTSTAEVVEVVTQPGGAIVRLDLVTRNQAEQSVLSGTATVSVGD